MLWEKHAVPFLVLTLYYLLVRLHLIGKANYFGFESNNIDPLSTFEDLSKAQRISKN